MGKILVFLFDEMTDYEITLAIHLLGADAGKEIITISYEDSVIRSRCGLQYKSSRLVRDVIDEDVEGLILCGGWYGDIRSELLQLIRNMHEKKRLLAAICGAGTVFLAKAGVLDSLAYTTPAVEWTQEHQEVFGDDPFPRENLVRQTVVRDANVITAQGTAFIDFAIEVCDWFQLFDNQAEKDHFRSMRKGL